MTHRHPTGFGRRLLLRLLLLLLHPCKLVPQEVVLFPQLNNFPVQRLLDLEKNPISMPDGGRKVRAPRCPPTRTA
jgi:hypothetical protein